MEVHKTGIGASDAAAAVGLSPYKSPWELWLEKTGRDATLPKPDPKDTTEPVYWGTLLEPIVAAAYTQQTERKVRKVNAVLQHPQHRFMLANIDRGVIGNPGVQILECKTAGEYGAVDFSDDRTLSATFADLMLLRADIQDRQAQAEKLKQALQQAIGNAESAQFETGRVTFKRSKDATLLDVDGLLLDHPTLIAAYASTRPGSRRFRVLT